MPAIRISAAMAGRSRRRFSTNSLSMGCAFHNFTTRAGVALPGRPADRGLPASGGDGAYVQRPGNPILERTDYSGTILPGVPTLAERLRKGGYNATMMTGKWHLGTEPHQSPIARGFDRFYMADPQLHRLLLYGFNGAIAKSTSTTRRCCPRPRLRSIRATAPRPGMVHHRRLHRLRSPLYGGVLRKTPGQAPFLLYIAHNAPHFPLHAREEDTKKYRGRFKDVGWDKLRQDRYERMVKMGLIDKKWALSPLGVPKWKPTTRRC